MKQKRKETSLLPLEDTAEKIERRQAIENTESLFLNHINLKKLIRLKDLEKPDQRLEILNQLSDASKQPIRVHPNLLLDVDHEVLLIESIEKSLLEQNDFATKSQRRFADFKDYSSLQSIISNYSFLYAIEQPEIGELFHLPEIDTNLVGKLIQK